MNNFHRLIGNILSGGESITLEQHRGSIPVIKEISLPEFPFDNVVKDWSDSFDREYKHYSLFENLLLKTIFSINKQFPFTNHFFIIIRDIGLIKLNQLPREFFHHHVDCSANLDYMYRYGRFTKRALNNIDVYHLRNLNHLLEDKPLIDALVFGYRSQPDALTYRLPESASRFNSDWLETLRGIETNGK